MNIKIPTNLNLPSLNWLLDYIYSEMYVGKRRIRTIINELRRVVAEELSELEPESKSDMNSSLALYLHHLSLERKDTCWCWNNGSISHSYCEDLAKIIANIKERKP